MTETPGRTNNQPQGRFRRVWAEFEVELVDRDALGAHKDLLEMHSPGGEFLGLANIDDNERIQFALTELFMEAVLANVGTTGIGLLGGSMFSVRYLDSNGDYEMHTLPSTPVRRDDGSVPWGE